ncbi:MAG: MFS transporter [Rhodobacterales bacterium]|nr:MFS transporter [Rhodobacterales bacterium]
MAQAEQSDQVARAPALTMPPLRAAGFLLTAAVLAAAQGFSQNMVSANVQQLQGAFGATQAQTSLMVAVYMAPNVSLTAALIKIRAQFGLRNFAEISIIFFIAATLLNYAASDFYSTLGVRFISGVAAAPMTSLAFLYTLEPFPPERKLTWGLCFVLTVIFIAAPLTRLISPHLLEVGLWHGLTAMEVALAAICLGLIYIFPLASPPREKTIQGADVISFILIAASFGSLAVVFVLGPVYWWTEHDWLGWMLAAALGALALGAVAELNRKTPLLDIRWLSSPSMLHFASTMLLFRLVLSEQTSGAAGFFRTLGLLNDQMQVLWAIILGATILGGAICALTMKPGREPWFHVVALGLLIAGSLMDARVTSQTGPEQMYLSQLMIALAAALFLPPALSLGMRSALARGREYILSFIIVFLITQKIGGIFGGAVFSSFIQIRQRLHLERLYEAMPATNPLVAERLAALAGAVADPSQRAAQAARSLGGQAAQQAAVMAYGDAFHMVAWVSALALALLLGHIALTALRGDAAESDD